MPESLWYYAANGRQDGPHDIAAIKGLLEAGSVDEHTHVWSEGLEDWVPLYRSELRPLLGDKTIAPPAVPSQPNGSAGQNALLGTGNGSLGLEGAKARSTDSVISLETGIPGAQPGYELQVEELRDSKENFYLNFIWGANVLTAVVLVFILIAGGTQAIPFLLTSLLYGALFGLFFWLAWKLGYAHLYGNSIEVTKDQYPQIDRLVNQACAFLKIERPTVLVCQGHGMFELMLAKKFTKRGVIVLTSNMVDEFSNRPDSRELMMYIGRQLGHIKAGHFHYWFLKDVIGRLAIFFHAAWQRRCHYTADRIGLLAAGDLYAAEQALTIITVGSRIAPGTNFDSLQQQRSRHYESLWAWISLLFSGYPYMIDRIVKLREFGRQIGMKAPNARALPIDHSGLRSIPVLLIHGHDQMALLELKDLLHTKYPNVALKVMLTDHLGTVSMPEKFERVADQIEGAIALLTPDDIGAAVSEEELKRSRARQNVIMEIGFVWGRLGRERCMVMTRGDIELPSDLSGIDFQRFEKSPRECVFEVQTFLDNLKQRLLH